jgi:hypothetical protein
MGDQTDQEQNQENEEQDLRNACGCKCNGSESEEPGNHRDNQKNQRIVKHRASVSEALKTVVALRPNSFPCALDVCFVAQENQYAR